MLVVSMQLSERKYSMGIDCVHQTGGLSC
jgi:hypothetical protein